MHDSPCERHVATREVGNPLHYSIDRCLTLSPSFDRLLHASYDGYGRVELRRMIRKPESLDEWADDVAKWAQFERELTTLVNKYSLENMPDMADFVIAKYLVGCLKQLSYARVEQSVLERAEMRLQDRVEREK